MERDSAVARAEWLAEWRDDVSIFLSRELIEASVDVGVTVRPPRPGVAYRAFADPSGGAADSFTAAVSHAEGDTIFLDCLVEVPAPFNPSDAMNTIAGALKPYRISSIVSDRYAHGWVVDAFQKVGIRVEHSERDRSAIFGDALPIFTGGRARLLDNKRLVNQFAQLERRVSPGGRDRITHPNVANAHDDAANAAAGAMTLAAGAGGLGPIQINPGFMHRLRMAEALRHGVRLPPENSECFHVFRQRRRY
jgi:hypothetical protein